MRPCPRSGTPLPRLPRALSARDGVKPPQRWEPEEIRVRRVEDGFVLQRNGRDLGVCGEIPRRAEFPEQPQNVLDVPRARFLQDNRRLFHPGTDVSQRLRQAHGCEEDSAAGGDPDETETRPPGSSPTGSAPERHSCHQSRALEWDGEPAS